MMYAFTLFSKLKANEMVRQFQSSLRSFNFLCGKTPSDPMHQTFQRLKRVLANKKPSSKIPTIRSHFGRKYGDLSVSGHLNGWNDSRASTLSRSTAYYQYVRQASLGISYSMILGQLRKIGRTSSVDAVTNRSWVWYVAPDRFVLLLFCDLILVFNSFVLSSAPSILS